MFASYKEKEELVLISRLAPTPSGYLHIGNIFNFLVTSSIIKQNNGTLWLRIDDGDQGRVRDEYIQDIFECLNWLKISYDYGPRDLKEQKTHFTQAQFFDAIKVSLINESELDLFCCHCSRKDILTKSPNARYPGTCYDQTELLFQPSHSIRVKTRKYLPAKYQHNGLERDLSEEQHDLVLWKKDQSPCYHLLSLLHDQKIGTNAIVRGEDLLDSTAVQVALSQQMQLTFHQNKFFHHSLLSEVDGSKISKSTNKAEVKSLVDLYKSSNEFFEDLSDRLKLKINSSMEFMQLYEMPNWDELKVTIH